MCCMEKDDPDNWRERDNSHWDNAKYHDADYLREKYWGEGLDSSDIAEECDVSPDTILKWLKKTGVGTRERNEARRNWIEPGDDLIELLEGGLLGDGYLGVGSDGGGAYYQETDINKQYVSWLKQIFENVGLDGRIDKTHGNRENSTWRFTSVKVMDLRELWMKWYPNGDKHVPQGFEISPTNMLLFYLGDGFLSESHGEPVVGISDRKMLDGMQRIAKQLSDNGITASQFSQGVRIWKESHREFFEYLSESPYDPPECYDYKFMGIYRDEVDEADYAGESGP